MPVRKGGFFLTPDTWLIRLFQVLRFGWIAFLIVALYYALLYITPLLYPFIISLVIALLINRPVTLLSERLRFPRWLSVTVVLLALLTLLGGLIIFIITTSVIELGQLAAVLPRYVTELRDYIENQYYRLLFFYAQLDQGYQQTINPHLQTGLNSLTDAGKKFLVTTLKGLENFLLSLPNFATVFVISLLGAFFISKDFYLWETRFRRILPHGVNRRLDEVLIDLRNALVGFLKAQITLISITAAIVITGLLVLRVEYAITIGLLTGVVDLLPYLGTGTVFLPWIVYAFFKGQYSLVIGLSVLYGIVVIVRQIIEPKIVAENVGLDPLLTLVALFVGLNLFGFLGLIVGPVSLVVINALVKAQVFTDIKQYIKGKPL